jgi:hypothetical protein
MNNEQQSPQHVDTSCATFITTVDRQMLAQNNDFQDNHYSESSYDSIKSITLAMSPAQLTELDEESSHLMMHQCLMSKDRSIPSKHNQRYLPKETVVRMITIMHYG